MLRNWAFCRLNPKMMSRIAVAGIAHELQQHATLNNGMKVSTDVDQHIQDQSLGKRKPIHFHDFS